MSKMPAKKKSCFQITSVTQAQVAASSITDDTESLDDPDESRTEDVSSEILDVSRDFEPEVCDICSSEETLNSVAECETGVGPADGHHAAASGPPNGGFVFRNSNAVNASSHGVGGTGPGPAPQPTSAPAASSSTTTTSFSTSSRFRVIKLDHGTGEPFKRGRWTCTEFYEKDSEGSTASRSVDGTKHAGPLDHNSDSGPGATGGAVAAHGAHPPTQTEPLTDSGYVPPPHVPPVELHQQGYVVQAAGLGPGPSQTLIPSGHNGVHQPPPIQQAKSPNMPPISAAQQFYPVQQTQQQPGQNLPPAMPLNPADYRQQQNPPVALLSIGAAVSQGPSPVMTPAAGPTHMLGPVAQSVEPAGPGAVRLPAPVTVPHSGGGVAAGSMPMQPVGQHQQPAATGSAVPHALIPGAQNVPATAAALPSASGVPPQTIPPQVQTAGLGLAGQILQNQAQAAAARGGLAVCGFTSTPPAGTPQSEEVQRKTALRASGGAVGTDPLKPLVPESLQLAAAPVVNSLFGIPITMDGDEDRNPSTAFYQAFPSSRLRDSKAPADSASGASVVAIDNKIEQAMDLVKSHLMYAVREEVEVLKEQIKELYERNSVLERENAVLKSLANSDQLSQLTTQLSSPGSASPPQQHPQPAPQGPAGLTDSSQTPLAPQQPNTSSA